MCVCVCVCVWTEWNFSVFWDFTQRILALRAKVATTMQRQGKITHLGSVTRSRKSLFITKKNLKISYIQVSWWISISQF